MSPPFNAHSISESPLNAQERTMFMDILAAVEQKLARLTEIYQASRNLRAQELAFGKITRCFDSIRRVPDVVLGKKPSETVYLVRNFDHNPYELDTMQFHLSLDSQNDAGVREVLLSFLRTVDQFYGLSMFQEVNKVIDWEILPPQTRRVVARVRSIAGVALNREEAVNNTPKPNILQDNSKRLYNNFLRTFDTRVIMNAPLVELKPFNDTGLRAFQSELRSLSTKVWGCIDTESQRHFLSTLPDTGGTILDYVEKELLYLIVKYMIMPYSTFTQVGPSGINETMGIIRTEFATMRRELVALQNTKPKKKNPRV